MTGVEVTSREAAHLVGVQPSGFREWARRRGLAPRRQVRRGSARVNLWDAEQVLDAQEARPVSWRSL